MVELLTQSELDDNCVDLKKVCHLFGMGFGHAQNLVYQNKFPVPTIRRGRYRVINKRVLADYLRHQDEVAWQEWKAMNGGTW
jgi:hypothetical protein